MPALCPPTGVVDCDSVVQMATATLCVLQNKRKRQNFIWAEITSLGFFKCYVENLPKDKTGCPGGWLFQVAWDYFVQEEKVAINGVRGDWTFGDNLDTVNKLTAGNQMTLEEAARHTWTYQLASQRGFTRYQYLDSDGSPDNFTDVQVVFLQ